mgnify:CR=1 FL=1
MAGFSLLYVWFSRFLFSLAERTRLAFSPQDMAAKRYKSAHFRAAKKWTSVIAILNFLNRAVEICSTLSWFFETNFSPICFFNLEKTLAKLCRKSERKLCEKQRFNFSAAPTGFYFFKLCVVAIPAIQFFAWKLSAKFELNKAPNL